MVIINENAGLYPGMRPVKQLPKVPETAPVLPLSGRYLGEENKVTFDLRVDVDKIREFSVVLNKISGTIFTVNDQDNLPGLNARAIYFQKNDKTPVIENGSNTREIQSGAKVVGADGSRWSGRFKATFTFEREWTVNYSISFGGNDFQFNNTKKSSEFFRDVNLDIDYARESVEWPIFELFRMKKKPTGMGNRKLDAFSAFEDAGVKLSYNPSSSQKVYDPTPDDSWTKADLYHVMADYFNTGNRSSNVWCMLGNKPPDKRFMGFSFDKEGFDSEDPLVKAQAQRRLLHYFVHECGHCLGLKHPFDVGQPNSLSWMNYAWRYDNENGAGKFYDSFAYKFSNDELVILRHSPYQFFIDMADAETMRIAMGEKYSPKSDTADETGTPDDDDEDLDAAGENGAAVSENTPPRKIQLGRVFALEAQVKNVGKLPVLIDGDLSPESGNLKIYLTTPKGEVKKVDPYIKPIASGYDKPVVLYTAGYREGPDRLSDVITIGNGSYGYSFSVPGDYIIKAKYKSGKYSTTTKKSYKISVLPPSNKYSKEAAYQATDAVSIGGSSRKEFSKVREYYDEILKEPIPEQTGHVASLVAMFEGLTTGSNRDPSDDATTPQVEPKKFLKDTNDVIEYYNTKGEKHDNIYYSKLVLKRTALYIKDEDQKSADNEFNQMLANLVRRGVKYDVIGCLTQQYQAIKNPEPESTTYPPSYLQDKLEKIVRWIPTYDSYDGESDYSGIGLGKPFIEFDRSHLQKSKRITDMLENKYEETKDLNEVIEYADNLQKGREVNHKVLQHAVRAYVVHSNEAHHAGIKYPKPSLRDKSLFARAAMISIVRKGKTPSEDFMNYWRNDADLNDHHEHWHTVYNAGRTPGPHLERQGELFGYMHSQMLARYDAERESWGLRPVLPWQYDEIAPSYDAGSEFHNSRNFRNVRPRFSRRMEQGDINRFTNWEGNYKKSIDESIEDNLWETNNRIRGQDTFISLDPNWSGHVLESSSNEYESVMDIGSLHNLGHVSFGLMTVPVFLPSHYKPLDVRAIYFTNIICYGHNLLLIDRCWRKWNSDRTPGFTSYMMMTSTAVRDPIFFRWHKRIDMLWQECNETWYNELTDNMPQIIIDSSDIVITHKPDQPGDFDGFSNGDWTTKPDILSELKTSLVEPKKLFEWDDKLEHDAFYYHIRFKRIPGSVGDLRLTFRIFICPENRSNERTRWIEMDKFVYGLNKNQDYAVFTRSDKLSSVIRRDPGVPNDNDISATERGFCECGWPYTMLLPRGTPKGERYKLCVFVSDNVTDAVNVRTGCGSLSFCGAQNQHYPDARPMGYPFSVKSAINNKLVTNIAKEYSVLQNVAFTDFIIKNREWDEKYDEEEHPEQTSKVVWPVDMENDQFPMPTHEPFSLSSRSGHFRIFIYDDDCLKAGDDHKNVRVRFKGRGRGNGAYEVGQASIGDRDGMLRIKSKTSLTVNGKSSFTVPEDGLWTDSVEFLFDPALGEYVVNYTLNSPGCLLYKNFSRVNTYAVLGRLLDVTDDWDSLNRQGVRISGSRALYCVEKIESL